MNTGILCTFIGNNEIIHNCALSILPNAGDTVMMGNKLYIITKRNFSLFYLGSDYCCDMFVREITVEAFNAKGEVA
jgi:hypothetical protein